MKKYISYLLMLAVLISSFSIATPAALAADSVVAKFNSAEDLANWGYKYYGNSTPTEADLSEDYVRMGQYSLKISDVSHGGGSQNATNYLKLMNINSPVNGASYINIWVYSQPGDGAVELRWAYSSTNATVSGTGRKLKLAGGWELISLPIAEAYRNDTLKEVRFSTEGYSMPSSGDNYKNTTLWISGVFLSDAIPARPKITASTIAEGAQLVKHDVGKINLGAKAVSLPEVDKIAIAPAAAYHLEKADDDTLSIVFDEDLDYGTNYTVTIAGGVYDIFGMEFEPYTLNFRTRGENENIPPVAEMIAPLEGER